MSLQAFFAENVNTEITEEVVVSTRFKDQDGNPIHWKIKTVTEGENQEIRRSAIKKTKSKRGQYTNEMDGDDYVLKLTAASVVYPDLKNADLQKSYGVIGAEALLKKMLLPGEFALIVQKVQEINGFDQDINDLVDEVKN